MCGALSSHRQPIRVKWYGVIACIVSVMEREDTVCPCAVCIKKEHNKDNKKNQSIKNKVCMCLGVLKVVFYLCGDMVARKYMTLQAERHEISLNSGNTGVPFPFITLQQPLQDSMGHAY